MKLIDTQSAMTNHDGEEYTNTRSLIGENLSMMAFSQLSGQLANYSFVKVVVERKTKLVHFINNNIYKFHSDYIADMFLKIPAETVDSNIDKYNRMFYIDSDRPYYLGVLALHKNVDKAFFSLETVEIDTMNLEMICEFLQLIAASVDQSMPVFFKPANHDQEAIVDSVEKSVLPRVRSHQIFSTAEYVALNSGTSKGRLRIFKSEQDYQSQYSTIEWYDIIFMHRVPDDIPRVSGIINAQHTTPLSHTNVLASGWQIPNAIQIGLIDRLAKEDWNGAWVKYTVEGGATQINLEKIDMPKDVVSKKPVWSVQKISLETPEIISTPIVSLATLKMSDRYKYGTKAANLGELNSILTEGSDKLLGFYSVKRPPRANLLPYLAQMLKVPETADLSLAAWSFLKQEISIPQGIAIPFSVQQQFLESSPIIQQTIGKLKMALELNAKQVDALCINLQNAIRSARMPESIKKSIDSAISTHLAGSTSFVVRSSSNAEDLQAFSAAGIYESINHVTTAEKIFESVKHVWASLISPRSVKLRQEVGISLDDSYMGVVIQEEVKVQLGGVLVTTNPMNRGDFRNVYLNATEKSVVDVVQGSEKPHQFLFNTVEGGGKTLSIGQGQSDISAERKQQLQKLALAGRLLQSHFSPDYTFNTPVDIEWLISETGIHILQLRLYS
jgi:hypothetical protein